MPLLDAFKSLVRRPRADAAAHAPSPDAGPLPWPHFELLVREHFDRQGYLFVKRVGDGPGADLVVQRGPNRFLVLCGCWRQARVGEKEVRRFCADLDVGGVAGGFVVTTGEFDDGAVRATEGHPVTLIDGRELLMGLRGERVVSRPRVLDKPARGAAASPAPAARRAAPAMRPLEHLQANDWNLPDCPKCGSPMVTRVIRTGAQAGERFWGCSSYAQTRCTGVRRHEG